MESGIKRVWASLFRTSCTINLVACLAFAGCVHGKAENRGAAHPTMTVAEAADFLEFLPESPAPKKRHCILSPGQLDVLAPPGAVGDGTWAFVNLQDEPQGCAFRQGFVATAKLSGPRPSPLADAGRGSGSSPQVVPFDGVCSESPDNEREATAGCAKKPHQDASSNANRIMAKQSPGAGERLAAVYANRQGYESIESQVLGWYGERREGCVAFASTALRQVGALIPGDALVEADPVSIVTKPFVEYLLGELRYQRIDNVADAQPGDIGVTVSDPKFEGYPTHVFVFMGWQSKKDLMALVVDNQGYTHPRPLLKSADPKYVDKDPTAFFVRPL